VLNVIARFAFTPREILNSEFQADAKPLASSLLRAVEGIER
jgi:hypothetical protein